MKIYAVADALLPGIYMKKALEKFVHKGDDVTVISWGENDEEAIDRRARKLELAGPTVDEPPDEIYEHIEDTNLLMVHYCPVSEELLKKAHNLKILATCRMGTQNIDLNAANRQNILAFHVIGRTTEAVSDLAIGLLLCEARNIARGDKAIKSGVWRKSYINSSTTPEIQNKVVGIIGFGEIGRAVLRKLVCFNANFIVYDPFVSKDDIEKSGAKKVRLEELLKRSDFVTLHSTVTQESRNLLGPKEFEMMKPTAYLINTARSELIDEQALCHALKNQKISGAAIDVFKDEPLPHDHPFINLDNITLTPHIASSTLECLSKSPLLLVKEILAFFETGKSKFILNPELLNNRSFKDFIPS